MPLHVALHKCRVTVIQSVPHYHVDGYIGYKVDIPIENCSDFAQIWRGN